MLGKERMIQILHDALAASNADMTQVTITFGESNLTRFAHSSIHQNVNEKNARLAVKSVIGKKIGYATTNRLDEASIKAVVDKSASLARFSQENRDFVSLPAPMSISSLNIFDDRTADYSPEDRASDVVAMIDQANRIGASASGAFSTGYEEFGVVNSLGIEAYYDMSSASVSTVMTSGTGNGYADRYSENIDEIDFVNAAIEAATCSVKGQDPISIDPGEYDVILLPYAVNELLEFLAYMGFGALSVQEGKSFMSGKFGQKVTGSNISIWDDGLDISGLPRPFDPEGVPKQRVDMIVDGVANQAVYDSYTAGKEGKRSTGHASGGMGTYGPMPMNMFMAAGQSSIEEMIASTRKGVFVTRFHYTNEIHPIQTLITGMTRDGTFLIEDGQITKPLKNLRFTDSITERLSNVDLISKEVKRQSVSVVPAIKARGFRFTGTTEF